jgi:sugar/nucleoside kinase (ribokinase family)
VVVKKGEHGSLLFAGEKVCALPSYPAQKVVDPTGAGDSFAGAMMGYLAAVDSFDAPALRKAIALGTVTASIELEDFSLNRFLTTTRADIDARLAQYKELTTF